MPNRNTTLLTSLDGLEAGDVVLFRTVYRTSLAQRFIGFYQRLVSQKHGHYDTVHAGICLGHDKHGPIIAHVTGENYFSYVKEPLLQSNCRDNENRPLIIYRHKNKALASKIAEVAAQVEKQKVLPKWEFSAALKVLFAKTKDIQKAGAISQSTFCSKFTIEILQQVTQQTDSYLAMNSTSSPKALEAKLYNNKHYDLLVYTGSPKAGNKKGLDPYEVLRRSIVCELDRLGAQKQTKSVHEKYVKIKLALFNNVSFLEEDALIKAQRLLADVMPVLAINTGFGFRTPASYKNISAQARKLGIFRWDKNEATPENRSAISPSICGKLC